MKLSEKYTVKLYQTGGEMAAPAEAAAAPAQDPAAAGQGQDPLMQIAEMAAQALQSQDCQTALAVCDAFMQLAQGASQEQAAPATPVYKKGGKLVKRISKA